MPTLRQILATDSDSDGESNAIDKTEKDSACENSLLPVSILPIPSSNIPLSQDRLLKCFIEVFDDSLLNNSLFTIAATPSPVNETTKLELRAESLGLLNSDTLMNSVTDEVIPTKPKSTKGRKKKALQTLPLNVSIQESRSENDKKEIQIPEETRRGKRQPDRAKASKSQSIAKKPKTLEEHVVCYTANHDIDISSS